jgi:hypothetical protein
MLTFLFLLVCASAPVCECTTDMECVQKCDADPVEVLG